MMSNESAAWKDITDKYMSEEAKQDFAQSMPKMGSEFDQATYSDKWKDLGSRIKAALPLDPASGVALDFVREWFALLEPFTKTATPAMWEGVQNMYANMDSWQGGAADPGFDAEIFGFIQQAIVAAKTAGHNIGPMPQWIK